MSHSKLKMDKMRAELQASQEKLMRVQETHTKLVEDKEKAEGEFKGLVAAHREGSQTSECLGGVVGGR